MVVARDARAALLAFAALAAISVGAQVPSARAPPGDPVCPRALTPADTRCARADTPNPCTPRSAVRTARRSKLHHATPPPAPGAFRQPAPPIAVISGLPPRPTTAGDTVTLSAVGSSCSAGACAYGYTVTCAGYADPITHGAVTPESPLEVTTGAGGGVRLDMAGRRAAVNCSVTLTVLDTAGGTDTAYAWFLVSAWARGPPAAACSAAAPPRLAAQPSSR